MHDDVPAAVHPSPWHYHHMLNCACGFDRAFAVPFYPISKAVCQQTAYAAVGLAMALLASSPHGQATYHRVQGTA